LEYCIVILFYEDVVREDAGGLVRVW
jgi:hypothetical protein